jgi:2-C-methyl-D-erythritol 2,4-cyclodiphosphate synthase
MQQKFTTFRTGLGRDSHRFLPADSAKPCVVAGVIFEDVPGLDSDSDGDVVFHAICNAITSLSGVPILGGLAKDLCRKDGITDSQVYVERAAKTLGKQEIVHVALSIEGKRPFLRIDQVGLSANSGDGLTDFGCGDGLQCFCILTTVQGDQ